MSGTIEEYTWNPHLLSILYGNHRHRLEKLRLTGSYRLSFILRFFQSPTLFELGFSRHTNTPHTFHHIKIGLEVQLKSRKDVDYIVLDVSAGVSLHVGL